MAVVYAVQNQKRWDAEQGTHVPRFDLSAAQEFGTLRFMLSPTANPFSPGPIIKDLARSLQQFTLDDYLLLIGNPCLIGWATAMAAYTLEDEGKLQLLQWNGRERKYVVVEADVLGPLADMLYPMGT